MQPQGDSFPAPSLVGLTPAPPSASPAEILRKLNFEMLSELGQGSFGIVFLCRSVADKLKVAVKLVLDPSNAKEAMPEGQKLSNVDQSTPAPRFCSSLLAPAVKRPI